MVPPVQVANTSGPRGRSDGSLGVATTGNTDHPVVKTLRCFFSGWRVVVFGGGCITIPLLICVCESVPSDADMVQATLAVALGRSSERPCWVLPENCFSQGKWPLVSRVRTTRLLSS